MKEQKEMQHHRRAILSKYGLMAAAIGETTELSVAISYRLAHFAKNMPALVGAARRSFLPEEQKTVLLE